MLIKWSILYGEKSPYKRIVVNERNINYLIGLFYNLGGLVRMPSAHIGILLWMRKTAFQQFIFQENPRNQQITQQSLLFKNLPQSHSLKTTFLNKSNLEIEEFLILSLFLIVLINKPNRNQYFDRNIFKPIEKSVHPGAIDAFLKILSKSFTEIYEYLNTTSTKRISKEYEFYEQSPLKRFPLLKVDERFYCYSPVLFMHSINSFVFDSLKSENPSEFMNSFGPIFERYVENGFKYSKVTFITESQIKIAIGVNRKVVDFIIIDDDVAILVDAKGVDLPPIGMLTHLHEVLSDKTRNSILKAVSQAFDTWDAISSIPKVGGHEMKNRIPYLLVVTYKELYLGTGQDFITNVAADYISDLKQKYGGNMPVPPENIYFLSLNDFDYLVEAMNQGKSIKSILSDAIICDSQPSTKRFIFMQHVLKYNTGLPEYIKDEFDNMVALLKNKFINN